MTRTRRSKARSILAAAILLVPPATLAGGAAGSTRAPGAVAASSATTTSVVIAQGADATTLDPAQHRETTTQNVIRHLYDPLLERGSTRATRFKSPSALFTPVLATSWKRVNATTMRLNLRRGVRFSGGQTFDAETVKYNIDRLLGKLPNSSPALGAYRFGTYEGARVVNRYTVDIITKAPDPLLLDRLATLGMIPNGAVTEDPKALASEPNGTGPYSLVRWDRNNEVVLAAKRNYFLGRPKVNQVIFRTLPDPASRLAALRAGTVDVITNVPPDNVREVLSTGRATVKSVPSVRVAAVWLNTLDNPILAKAKVRQALNHAVDVNAIIKQVMGRHGIRLATTVAPYFKGHNPALKPYPYDPRRQRR